MSFFINFKEETLRFGKYFAFIKKKDEKNVLSILSGFILHSASSFCHFNDRIPIGSYMR